MEIPTYIAARFQKPDQEPEVSSASAGTPIAAGLGSLTERINKLYILSVVEKARRSGKLTQGEREIYIQYITEKLKREDERAQILTTATPEQRAEWKRKALEHVAKGPPYPKGDPLDPGTWNLDPETRIHGAKPGEPYSFAEDKFPEDKLFDWPRKIVDRIVDRLEPPPDGIGP